MGTEIEELLFTLAMQRHKTDELSSQLRQQKSVDSSMDAQRQYLEEQTMAMQARQASELQDQLLQQERQMQELLAKSQREENRDATLNEERRVEVEDLQKQMRYSRRA